MNRAGAGTLSLAVVLALFVGAATRVSIVGLVAIAACLCVATFVTIGGLEVNWHRSPGNYRTAVTLLMINILAGSIPVAIVGLCIGKSTPAGMGFLALAVVPVAAGIPAYAGALGVPAERMSLFALVSYVGALAVTPLFLGLVLGGGSTWMPLVLTVLVGLVLPSVGGIVTARHVKRVPVRARRSIVITALLTAMFGLGGALHNAGVGSAEFGAPIVLVVLLGLLRAPIGGLIGVALGRHLPSAPTSVESALAGGYKNCALAGASAIAAGVPAAAVPSAIGLVSEALLLGVVALGGNRIGLSAPGPAGGGRDRL